MEKIAEKVKTKKLNVSLETVTKKKVKCVIEEMKKKKSLGLDGIDRWTYYY